MIGALGKQPVDEGGVNAVRRKHRLGDSLWRILIEVEACRAKRQIEICHDRIEGEIVRDGKGDVVGDSRSADTTLGSDHGDDPSDRLGIGRGEQSAHPAHDLQCADRRDQIIAHAAPHQLPVEPDVIHAADDHDPRAGVAIIGKLIEAFEDILVGVLRI